MLPQDLTDKECRIIGCLMEKSIVTPDQYPLTLNALTNACNQKSSRNPIMSLSQGDVQHTIRTLEVKKIVRVEENFNRGVEKYAHRFCNTQFSELKLDSDEFAIICLFMLRGPQTPGELRAHSGRLHSFADNEAVVKALSNLTAWEGDPIVVKLPRTPGRKDSEYMHLFSGAIDIEAYAGKMDEVQSVSGTKRTSLADLEHRVSNMESELEELKKFLYK